jgi:hypothetical protein
MTGVSVVILGVQVAVEREESGYYGFEEPIFPGDYTFYAYTDMTDVYRDDFTVVEGMERINWHIMLDICVDDQTSMLTGKVTAKDGSPIRGVRVGISDLFIETETNKDGKYNLIVPPGEWVVTVGGAGYGVVEKTMEFVGPDEPGMEINTVKYDVTLSAQ